MCANTTLFKPSQPLDSGYRTLVTTYKLGNYRRKWLLYVVFVKIIFNATKGDTTMKKLEKTDDVDEKRQTERRGYK